MLLLMAMAGRPKIFDSEIALDKAANLFWEKGYEATSTEDLLAAMDLQRGSMYNAFGSKKNLYKLALDRLEKKRFAAFKRRLSESDQPIEVIRSIFLKLAKGSPSEYYKGCFLGNTVAELSNIDAELTGAAQNYLKMFEDILYRQIKAAQQRGELSTKESPKVLARYLVSLWNGINITRRIYPEKKLLLPFIEMGLNVLR